jgi:hypothetical protein
MEFRGMEWGGMGWIQDEEQWRALTNTLMNFWVP